MRWRNWKSTKWFKLKRNPKLNWGFSLGIGGLLYLKVWLPATNIGIPCVFHELTGFYCPGCGITRSVLSLLQLDVYHAYRENPLVYWILPMYFAYALAKRRGLVRVSHAMMGAMLILTVTFGILRNVPAFEWLAPTKV